MLRYGKKLDRNEFLNKVADMCESYGISRIVSTTQFYGTEDSASTWYATGSLEPVVRLMQDLDVIYEDG